MQKKSMADGYHYRFDEEPTDVCAAAHAAIPGPVSFEVFVSTQASDPTVQQLMKCLKDDLPVQAEYKNVRSQLVVRSGVLYRSVKLPIEGSIFVPI